MTDVSSILKTIGPCLSNRLAEEMVKAGVTPDAARQRISRALGSGSIKRLKGISFPKRAGFIYLESQAGSHSFWDALMREIDSSNPAYSVAIHALAAKGGRYPLRYFPIICGSPVRQKKQISAGSLLDRLEGIQLIRKVNVSGEQEEYISINPYSNFLTISDTELKGRLLAEKILLLAVKSWAQKNNLISYNLVKVRGDPGELPLVGTCNWDLCGPSYLKPLTHRKVDGKTKPGFLVCDIFLGTVLNEKSIQGFLRKLELTWSLPNISPILPVLIAEGYSQEAFAIAKRYGVIVATTESLFGKDVAAGLSSLMATMAKIGEMSVHRPEVVNEIFSKLSGIEGAANNLRGALFELLVGHAVVQLEDGSIDIGKILYDPTSGNKHEIDVFRVKERREVWAYECKGRQPTSQTGLEEVKDWCERKVPSIYQAIKKEPRFSESEIHIQYWTCGKFTDEALDYLIISSKRTHRYFIGYKDGAMIREYFGRLKKTTLLKTFDEHYHRHPITVVVNNFPST